MPSKPAETTHCPLGLKAASFTGSGWRMSGDRRSPVRASHTPMRLSSPVATIFVLSGEKAKPIIQAEMRADERPGLIGREIPEPHGAIGTGREQPTAVGAERREGNVIALGMGGPTGRPVSMFHWRIALSSPPITSVRQSGFKS